MLNPHEVILRASFRKELALCVLFPNIYGALIDNFAGSYATLSKGAFSCKVTGEQNLGFNAQTGGGGYFEFEFFASRNNSMYGSSLTNQPASLRSLSLIRAY